MIFMKKFYSAITYSFTYPLARFEGVLNVGSLNKYTRAIKIRNQLDRLNVFIYIVYLTAIRTKSLTINIVNTDGWRSHSHGGDSTLHKLSIFHHRV